MNFKTFLTSLSHLNIANQKLFVLGNSSADYDSVFGSLIYAYLLTVLHNKMHVPLIDCSVTDLSLRFEIIYVMKKFDINFTQLYYTPQINLDAQQNQFYLYDHNSHPGLKNIQGIIDHHQIMCQLNNKTIVSHMASVLTILYFLLHPKMIQDFPANTDFYTQFMRFELSKEHDIQDPIIQEIIHYGILLDSFNLFPSDRWTPYDKIAVVASKPFAQLTFQFLQSLAYSKELNLALTLQQHLKKDAKVVECGKISLKLAVIKMSAVDFFTTYQVKDDGLLLFAYLQGDNVAREIAIFEGDCHYIVLNNFCQSVGLKKEAALQNWTIWKDFTSTMTRKKLQKLLIQYLKDK